MLFRSNRVLEMTEGRRQREDNKGFKEIFDNLNKKLNDTTAKYEAAWKETYQRVVEEVTAQKPTEPAN